MIYFFDFSEAPEEVIDNRCLFERLEEQRMKKQDEYDDQFKLSKMIKILIVQANVFC